MDEQSTESGTPSHLFLVRLWPVERGGTTEWHGKVQHVLSTRAGCFEDWLTLVDLFVSMMPQMSQVPLSGEPPTTAPSSEPGA